MSDYIYYNNDKPEDFVKWLKLILFPQPLPTHSTFLCKTNSFSIFVGLEQKL